MTINSQTYRKYPLPNTASYVLEETSGFYYDALTCLYYDPNSHYYYNGTTQKYMYWSNDYQTYIPVESQQPTSSKTSPNKCAESTKPDSGKKESATANGSTSNGTKDEDKSKTDKTDKVKIAKKIAKDMEKWAKTLNQKNRESASGKAPAATKSAEETATTGTYSALSLGNTGISLNINNLKETVKPKLIDKSLLFDAFADHDSLANEPPAKPASTSTVSAASAAVSVPTASVAEDEDRTSIQKLNLTDWNKLICLLCKRQFASKEQLGKHQQASELHKVSYFVDAVWNSVSTLESASTYTLCLNFSSLMFSLAPDVPPIDINFAA